MPRLLLHSGGDSRSAFDDIAAHLAGAQRAVFLPYALRDLDAYTALVSERMATLGVRALGAHTVAHAAVAITEADAIIVGGGNSFRLLRTLHDLDLLDVIRTRVAEGIPYYGGSAGANVACPTIRTTNDMPIVETGTLAALHLVPFQINPHYLDAPPAELRVGETRAERLQQFLEQNDVPVIALREPSWLVVHGERMTLRGDGGAVIFRRGSEPENVTAGSDLSHLLTTRPSFDEPA